MTASRPGEERLQFVLAGQRHCDFYLSPLTDPANKTVLVAGCGAGTEMLWCLRRGAREVVGIDILEQDAHALEEARSRFDIDPEVRVEIHCLDITAVERLDREFDLVLSNNVFEHIVDVETATRACLSVLERKRGRLAIFSAPLYFSSAGSHLEHEPWEHLWGDAEDVRRKALNRSESPPEALNRMSLEDYLFGEITLNRLRFADYLGAFQRANAVAFKLGILPDRAIHRMSDYEPRVRARGYDDLSPLDLTVEGFFAELGPGRSFGFRRAVPDQVEVLHASQALDAPGGELSPTYRELERELAESRGRANALQGQFEELLSLLRSVETSPTFRLARFLSGPLRALRGR